MTLLVTGAGGLVGGAVVRAALAHGVSVVGSGRRRPDALPRDVEFVEADLLDHAAVERLLAATQPDCIVHAAWETRQPSYWQDPVNDDWAAATIGMAEIFAARGGRRFVQIGSCAEYDWTCVVDGRSLRDGPSTRYGNAKLTAFHGVQSAMRGAGEAVEARIFWVFGPGEEPGRFIPLICRAHAAGEVPVLGSGRQIRDLIFADDAGEAIVALSREGGPQGVVDIGSGEGTALSDVATLLAEIAGVDATGLGARPDRPDDPPCLIADAGPLRGLGWAPRTSLRDGLQRSFDCWRDAAEGAR